MRCLLCNLLLFKYNRDNEFFRKCHTGAPLCRGTELALFQQVRVITCQGSPLQRLRSCPNPEPEPERSNNLYSITLARFVILIKIKGLF